MENWKELLASFGLWLLVEDISDDGDGERDNLQLTKDGELFVSEIQQELDRAREEVLLELLEKKTNYKIERVDHGYKVTQEYVLVSDIEKELSKLSNK